MDPNANLREQLALARSLISQNDADENDGGTIDVCDATRLAELVVALHEWIDGGGFLPAAWRKTGHAK